MEDEYVKQTPDVTPCEDMQVASQPEPEPTIEPCAELDALQFPPEHASPLVSNKATLRMVSHGTHSSADVVLASSLEVTSGISILGCCTPRANVPCTPRGAPTTPRE